MRIERVIAVSAAHGVGPTRLSLLTAGSAKLPVVVIDTSAIPGAGSGPRYYLFDVASLQVALTNQLSATPIRDAIDLPARESRPPVPKSAAATATPGDPVDDNGALIGVVAPDEPERKEPGRGTWPGVAARPSESDHGRKRGLFKRLSRSDR